MHYVGLTDKQLAVFDKLNIYIKKFEYIFEAAGIHIPLTSRVSLTEVGGYEGSGIYAIDKYDLNLLAKLFFGAAEIPTTVEFKSDTGVYVVVDATNGSEKILGVQEFINLFTNPGALNLRKKPRYALYLESIVYPSPAPEKVRGGRSGLVFLRSELVGRPAKRKGSRKNKQLNDS